MLQYPTSIYPDGNAFDASVSDSNNKISFVFNGDFFTGALYKVYNYDTGSLVKSGSIGLQSRIPSGYNGDTITSNMGEFSTLGNGNYVMQLQLFQYDVTGTNPLYDMFILRGVVQKNYISSDGYIDIEDNISNIYEWDDIAEGGKRHPSQIWGVLAGSMVIQIGSEQRQITYYDPVTGSIGLSSDFSSNIAAGTKYQIYANYVVSQQYFFKCRYTPDVIVMLSVVDYGTTSDSSLCFRAEGLFNGYGSLINHYKVGLYWNWKGTDDIPWRLLDETDKIYSQEIEAEFFDDFVLHYKKRVNNIVIDVPATEATDIYYKAVLEVVTTDGLARTVSSVPISGGGLNTDVPTTEIQQLYIHNNNIPDVFYPESMDSYIKTRDRHLKHTIHVVGGISPDSELRTFPEGTKYTYYRENLNTGELTSMERVDDVTIPTKGRFRYYEVPRKGSTGQAYLKGISYLDFELDSTKMDGCTITELILRDSAYQWGTKPRYQIGDQWKFLGEIENTTLTQNTDRAVHVGYGSYPIITRTNTNYLSGTLSAMNGYIDCTTKKFVDDIDTVRAWREFISRPSMFMLKTQKGDVLIISIVDNPTISYEENIHPLYTTFSFNWVEVANVNDLRIDYIWETSVNSDY